MLYDTQQVKQKAFKLKNLRTIFLIVYFNLILSEYISEIVQS